MGRVIKFRRKRRSRQQGQLGNWTSTQTALALGGAALGGVGALFLIGALPPLTSRAPGLVCGSVRVIDGDTFDCSGIRIRMQGIDAPEKPGHCRAGRKCTPGDPWASTANLSRLMQSGPVECRKTDTDSYGRTVARCFSGDVDLSCEQVKGGFAVKRYAPIWCSN